MLYRNFLAMEAEELLRQHPVDGAVLMGGCDKTTPGTDHGRISMNLPMIFMPAGPMMRGHLAAPSSARHRRLEILGREGGRQHLEPAVERHGGRHRAVAGTCMTMGTASTMTSLAETLGLTLPGASSIPAGDAAHPRMATACGRRIVEMIWEDLKPSDILDRRSFENALIVHNALGGSTNAMIHLVAMARPRGHRAHLEDFDDFAQKVPVIANLRPSGEWLMEDFYIAGGIRGLSSALEPLLHLDARTVAGTRWPTRFEGARSTTTTSSARSTIRLRPPAARRSCAAISRQTAA